MTDDRGPPSATDPAGARIDDTPVTRRSVLTWAWRLPVVAAIVAGVWGGVAGVRTHFFKRVAPDVPRFEGGPTVHVAAVDELTDLWDERTFVYGGVPAVLVRVPSPVAGGVTADDGASFAAFSRVCTHLGCAVVLARDPEAIAFATNVRVDGPRLICRCHGSVFDVRQAARPTGGPAILPLPRVRIELRGRALVATGIEPAPESTG